MDLLTLLVYAIVAFVILAIIYAFVRAFRVRAQRPRLTALPPESRERYVTQWDRIEQRFVDSPEDAVKEADGLLLAMLGERAHPLAGERLPAKMRQARREATRKGDTEGLRRALLHYRAVMEEYAGPATHETATATAEGRREIAS
jgi:hypothetical protein